MFLGLSIHVVDCGVWPILYFDPVLNQIAVSMDFNFSSIIAMVLRRATELAVLVELLEQQLLP